MQRTAARSLWTVLSGLVLAVLVGCSSGEAQAPPYHGPRPLLAGADCDPLVPQHCGFPFPSNVYLADDPTGNNPSGKSVRFGPHTLPESRGTRQIEPSTFYGMDGFSPGQAPMTFMPGATNTGLATPDDIATTVQPDSPTIILDTKTGKLVPHWVDLDYSTRNNDQRALMLRPAIRLDDETRYIVAIRGVVDENGKVIPPSSVFKALRDGRSSKNATVAARRDLYKDIFAKLAAAGVKKDGLQIAWDYTTASRDNNTRLLIAMRDKALAVVGKDGPSFKLAAGGDVENPDSNILRRITVDMTVPCYLTDCSVYDSNKPDKVGKLELGADGLPKQNGTMTMEVYIDVPNSVLTAGPHGLLQNGHGLFGSGHEGQDSYLAEMANRFHWVAFAMDLYGFAHPDSVLAINVLGSRPDLFQNFFDRQLQGHVNQLLAMRMMMGRVAKDGIKDASGKVLLDPAWIDPSLRAYRGDSQGGIMGATYMAISTDVTRGLLGEPGLPYDLLLNRSKDWAAFGLIMGGSYPNGLDTQLVLGLIQMGWDRAEPDGYAPYITKNTLPNTPSHHVLIHDALGDHQVTTYSAHILARTIGAVDVKSSDPQKPLIRDVYGIPAASPPLHDQNAMVEYDFGLPKEPLHNVPATAGDDPHDTVRKLTPSYEQADKFFRTGEIDWFCNGICNCNPPGDTSPGAEDGCPAN